MTRHPLRPTLFPYTTLFRSQTVLEQVAAALLRAGRGAIPMAEADAKARAGVAGGEAGRHRDGDRLPRPDRKSTRLNSSHTVISYAVFCLKKKINKQSDTKTD